MNAYRHKNKGCYYCGAYVEQLDRRHEVHIWGGGVGHLVREPKSPYYGTALRAQYNIFPYCEMCLFSSEIQRKVKVQESEEREAEYLKKYRKKMADQLSDSYVISILCSDGLMSRQIAKENPDIIDFKRLHIQTKRNLKNLIQ